MRGGKKKRDWSEIFTCEGMKSEGNVAELVGAVAEESRYSKGNRGSKLIAIE